MIPKTFQGHFITINDRVLVWQNNFLYTGYVYLG
jgi:hypothetical protein